MFSAVIAIHEFGHFCGGKALRHSGQRVFHRHGAGALENRIRKGTQYSLRALPVGGFVALEGEESPESQQAEAARDRREQPAPALVPPEAAAPASPERGAGLAAGLIMVAGAVL